MLIFLRELVGLVKRQLHEFWHEPSTVKMVPLHILVVSAQTVRRLSPEIALMLWKLMVLLTMVLTKFENSVTVLGIPLWEGNTESLLLMKFICFQQGHLMHFLKHLKNRPRVLFLYLQQQNHIKFQIRFILVVNGLILEQFLQNKLGHT